MRHQRFADDAGAVVVVVFDKGDESADGMRSFAADHGILGGSLTAVGAFQSCTLGYFDRDTKEYAEIEVDEQVEVLSFLGDVGEADDGPMVHVHVVVGRRDGSTVGGHLLRGVVWPTLEVVIRETPAALRRRHDPETGLTLITLP